MNKILGAGLLVTALATAGCATGGKVRPATVPDDAPATAPAKSMPLKSRVEAAGIDDTNYADKAKQLENEIRRDGRAASQADDDSR